MAGSNLTAIYFGTAGIGASSGTDVDVIYAVANTGDAPSAIATAAIILAASDTLTSNPHVAETFSIAALNPGEVRTYTRTVQMPNIGSGNYFLGLQIQSSTAGHDVIKDDNTKSTSFAIGPGLSGQMDLNANLKVIPAAVIAPGNSVDIQYTISANSFGSPPYAYRVLYSADEYISDDDSILYTKFTEDGLGKSGVHYYAHSVALPASAPNGPGYILVVADPLNAVLEREENNNVASRPIVVSSAASDVNSLSNIAAHDLSLSNTELEVGLRKFQ